MLCCATSPKAKIKQQKAQETMMGNGTERRDFRRPVDFVAALDGGCGMN
jgi:hypothetical protein